MKINKKQLKQQYKESKPPMGCFSLTCLPEGNRYIGSTKNLEAARNSLFFRLSVGALQNYPELQKHYTRFGEEQVTFSVLEALEYKEDVPSYDEELRTLKELYLERYADAKELLV
jgi:hypothetical protein